MKIKKSLLAYLTGIALSLSSCSSTHTPNNNSTINTPIQQATSETSFEKYRSNFPYREEQIEYKKFSEIDFSSIPKEKIPIPEHFPRLVLLKSRVKSRSKLHQIIDNELKKLKISKETISRMEPKDLILLARDITCNLLEYLDVDNNDEFKKKHPTRLPIEAYLEIGKGDCDKYTSAMIEIFFYFQINSHNPEIQNIHLFHNDRIFGTTNIYHDWNVIVIPYPDKIIISYIDSTRYDARKKPEDFERKLDWPDNRIFKALVLAETNPQLSLEILNRELTITPQNPYILEEKARLQYRLRDLSGLEGTLEKAGKSKIPQHFIDTIQAYKAGLENILKHKG